MSITVKSSTNLCSKMNLTILESRSRGDRFMVHKAGNLIKISGIFNRVYYFFNRANEQNKVKETIKKALDSIDLKKTPDTALKKLFFETIKPLSEKFFDRGELPVDLISKLKPIQSSSQQEEFASRVEAVRFAIQLGVEFELISEGDNGSYFGRDYKGKRLVVFKPYDEEGSSCKSPKLISKIKRVLFDPFPFLRVHKNIKRENAYLNEIGASSIDKYLNLGLIPNTKMERFKSAHFGINVEKKGSCQVYIEEAVMLQEFIKMPSFYKMPFFQKFLQKYWLILFGSSKEHFCSTENLKKLAIIEFLTGNQDGHTNNQMIKNQKLYAIDYGLAFPKKYPRSFSSTINQQFPLSDFSEVN